jgi:ribosomal protein S18 acetylase RimI-like enzyme
VASNSQDHFIIFARHNGEVIGMMSGRVLNNPERGDLGDTVKAGEVFVSEEMRNQGVGKKLLIELITQIKQNPKIKKMLIKVFTGQQAAIALYKSIGAEIKKEITKWPDGRKEQTYIMEKKF